MPSKKRKYNARFPAGRIKKIMQTDEEVGKVAQAVPIIISRTLELFVESLLSKALQVTMSRNAKTLSPSHVKQCILAESRFDFLRDLVKNIPDVSAAEEKEIMSEENSPNTSRFSEMSAPPRRVVREDSNSSSSSDVRLQQIVSSRDPLRRGHSSETEVKPTVTSTIVSGESAIDLTKRNNLDPVSKPSRNAPNFYQETLIEEVQHKSVITLNPTYATAQPSTSNYTILKPVEQVQRRFDVSVFNAKPLNNNTSTPKTPVTPILNIDFTKNLAKPEIKVLDSNVANIVGVKSEPNTPTKIRMPIQRQHSKPQKAVEPKPSVSISPVNIDYLNSGNLQIDEDYDT